MDLDDDLFDVFDGEEKKDKKRDENQEKDKERRSEITIIKY